MMAAIKEVVQAKNEQTLREKTMEQDGAIKAMALSQVF